jgi:16S rRNA (adenine1518-N6/adenine1519-N6)-dimethyltransferase
MALYRPTELKALLARLATGPKKGLSQNFLIDGNILRKITTAAAIKPNEVVLEIGPGPGALTECLLDCGAHVIAVERDTVFAAALQELPNSHGKLTVHCADILIFPLAEQLSQQLAITGGTRGKVVANLPYHLTSPILGLLLPLYEQLESAHVMVQEEVARRLTAKADHKDYSALTVFAALYGGAEYCFGVGRRCFLPAPRVDSAVVKLTLKAPPADIDPEAFMHFVHCAFGQRRKTLKSALSSHWPRNIVEDALQALMLPSMVRAEALTLADLLALYRRVIL